MDLMIAKRNGNEYTSLIIVILQDDGFAVPLNSNDDPISIDDLLFPEHYDEYLPKYVSTSIQGLLSNPNIVKSLYDITKDNDLYGIIFRAEEIALRLCYDNCLTKYVPLGQSILKGWANRLKTRKAD